MEKSGKNFRRWRRPLRKSTMYVIKLLVSAAALYFVFTKIDLQETLNTLRSIQIRLFVYAILLYLLSQVLSAIRLGRMLHAEGVEIPLGFNLRMYLIGMAYNLFLPGGIGGDAYKAMVFVRRTGQSYKKVVRALLYDRLSGLLAIALFIVTLASVIPLEGWWPLRPWYYILAPLGILLTAIYLRIFSPQYLKVYHESVLLALMVQAIQVFSIVLLFKSIPDAEISWLGMLKFMLIFLVSSVATAIPVFLGGIGAREAVFGGMAVWLGLQAGQMVQTAILFSILTIIASFPGLPLDWIRKQRPKQSEIAEEHQAPAET